MHTTLLWTAALALSALVVAVWERVFSCSAMNPL